jgi:ABC-type protease/lipase transport system fused ATPase/permease subunit
VIMSSRRPFLVLPRFPGASLVVLEPSTQWRQPDAARTPAQLAATVNTGLVVAVVASRERWASGVEHVLVLDDGRLLEHGSPTELSAATGVYATLRRSWDRGAG